MVRKIRRGTIGKKRRNTMHVRKRWRGQEGGFLPALIPLLALAGKAIALGAVSGAAGFGAKKALEAATK